jgi:hypothetical protein
VNNTTLIKTLLRSNSMNTPITIAHLDTGISVQHSASKYIKSMVAVDRQGHVRSGDVHPQGEHGNYTASILLGDGFAGLPELPSNLQLYSVCVPEGGKIVLNLLAGMEKLLDYPVQIACMAVGVPQQTPIFVEVVEKLQQKGVLLVVPIGNGEACAPGNYPHVLSVGAVNDDGRMPMFSSTYREQGHCIKPDILAPGVNIAVTNSRNEPKTCSGTSMATAYVAGVAARLKGARPNATADQLKQALLVTSQPPTSNQRHYSACGLIQPQRALDYLLTCDTEPPSVAEPVSEHGFLRQPYIDPRLRRQCDKATFGQRIDALVMARHSFDGRSSGGTRTMLQQVCQRANAEPFHCRFFNHVDLAHISADQHFYQQLLSNPDLMIGSAVDIDIAIFRS